MKRVMMMILGVLCFSACVAYAQSFSNSKITGDSVTLQPVARQAGAASLTQSLDLTTIIPANSVSCLSYSGHTQNSFMRRFFLDTDHGITSTFTVGSVTFGVESATSGSGTGQPLTVNLYTISKADPFTFANLTLIGTTTNAAFPDMTTTLYDMAVTGKIEDPLTQDLVVEVFVPDGQAEGNFFFIGSNDSGETHPSYLAAADCAVTEPATVASLGYPEMMVLMIVNGEDVQQPTSVPTMNEWGMIILSVLVGLASVYYLYRRREDITA